MDNTDLLQAVTVDLLWAAGFVAVEYLCVLLAVLADLWSGWRKAGRRKERRTSRGLRNTVMIIAGAAYLRSTQGWDIPIFPVCTLVGAVALALIEVKSICENASEKGDMQEAAALLKKVLSSVSAAEILAWIDRNRDS